MEIFRNVSDCITSALSSAQLSLSDLTCIGITNQRETLVVWDVASGVPLCNAIVWNDVRTESIARRFADDDDAGLGKDRFRDRCGLPLASYFSATKMVWVMENPVGSLEKQVYMGKRWKQPRKLEEVHYCAYGHVYNKPTHIWTNIYEWKPVGQTGTGKCECRCNAGRVGPKGKWRHRYKIAGDSSLEVQGRGKAAMKNMVPQQLQQEIWESWME